MLPVNVDDGKTVINQKKMCLFEDYFGSQCPACTPPLLKGLKMCLRPKLYVKSIIKTVSQALSSVFITISCSEGAFMDGRLVPITTTVNNSDIKPL